MKNEKPPITAEETEQNARMEIVEYARKEAEKKRTAHFSLGGAEHFDSAELTKDDLAFWEKVKNGTVTEKDCEEYRNVFTETSGPKNPSRHGFFSLSVNKAAAVIGRRWLAEELAEERKKEQP